MIKVFLCLYALLTCCGIQAQNRLESMANRLHAFGTKLTQEQVFLHMDNSCYYLGDTIFYKAYVKRCDNGQPTNLSGILYCELLNNDGFLVERQMIPLEKGEGHGNFALTDTMLYAGHYELRAYTKWQLNWGIKEQEHSKWAEDYFFNKSMAQDYYRDYEKLYSRVFPVYDKPSNPGDYYPDMTLRPLAAYYKNSLDKAETIVQFFPEGGNLVSGVNQRIAWEVRNEQGLALEGQLSITMPDGATIVSNTKNRGRGVFEITAPEGKELLATFTPTKGDNTTNPTGTLGAEAELPKAQRNGVAIKVDSDPDGLHIQYHATDTAAQEALGMTIMHNGVLHHFCQLDGQEIDFPAKEPGVYQATVFNEEGRVYADRLAFYLPTGFTTENVEFQGMEDGMYKPFEPISIQVHGTPGSSMSLAVRDAAKSEYTYDTGTMLTETLLSSQIHGFVPHPQWFFQKDDAERREALDLLLMVQGWRRYSWREMAITNEFELTHMPESRYPRWTGQIHNYSAEQVLSVIEQNQRNFADNAQQSMGNDSGASEQGSGNEQTTQSDKSEDKDDAKSARDRFNEKEDNLKYPIALHAEFSQPGTEGVDGDMKSQGTFSMEFPRYYEEFFFFLGASDTTKWKDGNPPIWTQNGRSQRDEVEFPEFYVKLDPFHPRFPKPYDYYQTHLAPMPKDNPLYNSMDEQVRLLSEVTVGARRNGRRRFSHWKPAFIIDAYEAFNATCDAGFAPGYFMGAERFADNVARTYIGDMKTDRRYDIAIRFDKKALTERTSAQQAKQKTDIPNAIPEPTSNIPDTKLNMYNYLWNLSDVVVYTDYSPRNDASNKYKGNDLPSVTVDLVLLKAGEVRSYQKNRRWKMKGFSVPDEYYSPDYSKHSLPKADYRRTLYWNPNVKLDSQGQAKITFYNNSSSTLLQIRAEGWAPDGTPQCGNVN